jgi:hypothetical protein
MVASSPAAVLGEKDPVDALCPIRSIRSALKAVGATAAAIGLPMSNAEFCRAATAGTLAVASAGSPKPPADPAVLLLMPSGSCPVAFGSPAILLFVLAHKQQLVANRLQGQHCAARCSSDLYAQEIPVTARHT